MLSKMQCPRFGDRIVPIFWGQRRVHVLGTGLCPYPGDRIVPVSWGQCNSLMPGTGLSPCAGPGALTLALVLDGEAEDVPGAEAGAVVHAAVEEGVRVGVLDVQDLARGGHVPRDALVGRDADLVALWARRGSGAAGTALPEPKTPLKPLKIVPLAPAAHLTSSSTTPPSNTLATSSWLRRSSRNTEHLQEATAALAPTGPPPQGAQGGATPPRVPLPAHISALLRFRASVMISWSNTETSSAAGGRVSGGRGEGAPRAGLQAGSPPDQREAPHACG